MKLNKMDIIQTNGLSTPAWQRLPVVPPQYQKYMDLFAQFPCIDMMMVGSLSSMHYTFMRQTKPRTGKKTCDLSTIGQQCKDVVVGDLSLGMNYVLQAWQDARNTPITQLQKITPLVIVSGILENSKMKISVSVKK